MEKVYTRAQIKQLKRTQDGFVEDEYDLNKKKYLTELRRSNLEKRIILGVLFASVLYFYMYGQQKLAIFNGYSLDEFLNVKI